MRLFLCLPLVAAVAACTAPSNTQIVTAPVTDPYVTDANGNAIYQGNVNRPGDRLPGAPAPVVAAQGTDFASVGDTVQFAQDQATLSPEAREILTRQAAWLSQNGAYSAVVEGHTDEPGTREFNLALGARRATSVQEYLVSKGVDAGRISTVSFGKEKPLETCTTEMCMARNRRAVTVVSAGAGV